MDDTLIPKHGGYRKLRSFQVAQLVYDLTVRFCARYIDGRSRTRDQMVQAARSGVQNIAEGSQASGTSKKTELKLTSVARASLEELRLDYQDFLRQRSLPIWDKNDSRREDLVRRKPACERAVAEWAHEVKSATIQSGSHGTAAPSASALSGPPPASYREILANAQIALITVTCYLLDRQLRAQARAFEEEGGFTERLYRTRKAKAGL